MLHILRKTALATAALASLLFFAPPTAPADTSTTQPAANPATTGQMRPGPSYVIQRFKRIVSQLDLTADQKPKVDAVFDHVNQEGLDLSQSISNVPLKDRYQKLIDFSHQIRTELAAVLTDDQMKTLDQKAGPAAAPRPGGAANGGAGGMGALEQAIAKLDLSDDQKQQIKDLLSSTRDKVAAIRKAGGDNMQDDLQQARKDLRDKLKAILTPDQLQTLGDALQQAGQNRRGPGSARNSAGKEPAAENKPADLQSTGPDVGSPVPSVKIIEANGRVFSPAQYKGRVIVLEFGSMSCPVFRAHAQDMEKLKAAEGGKAFFMIVYTREAFPAGDNNVERNRDEGISVPQAKTLDDRKAQALEAQRELRITIPLAVDSMDDAVSNAFGTFPNGTVVIGKDGTIAARQQWTNPDSLREMIDDANQTSVASTH